MVINFICKHQILFRNDINCFFTILLRFGKFCLKIRWKRILGIFPVAFESIEFGRIYCMRIHFNGSNAEQYSGQARKMFRHRKNRSCHRSRVYLDSCQRVNNTFVYYTQMTNVGCTISFPYSTIAKAVIEFQWNRHNVSFFGCDDVEWLACNNSLHLLFTSCVIWLPVRRSSGVRMWKEQKRECGKSPNEMSTERKRSA